jgi:hypothetical protein
MDCARLTAAAFLTTALVLATGQVASQTAQAQPAAAMSYLLPRQAVEVSISFELIRCGADTAVFRREATIIQKPEPDLNVGPIPFRLGRVAAGWTQETDLEIKLNADGTLQSIGAEVADQSAAVVGNLVSLVGTVARTVFLGRQVVPASSSSACTDDATKDLNSLDTLRQELTKATLADKQREAVLDAVSRLRERLTLKASDTLHPQAGRLTADAVVPEAAALRLVKEGWFKSNEHLFMGRLSLSAKPQEDCNVPLVAPAGAGAVGRPASLAPDFLYWREPMAMQATVCTIPKDNNDKSRQLMLARGTVMVAQLGEWRSISVDAKAFQDVKWTLSFAPDGSLAAMRVISKARLAAATAALASVATSARQFVDDEREAAAERRSTRQGAELAGLQAQTELLNARVALINARRALQKLEEGSAD